MLRARQNDRRLASAAARDSDDRSDGIMACLEPLCMWPYVPVAVRIRPPCVVPLR